MDLRTVTQTTLVSKKWAGLPILAYSLRQCMARNTLWAYNVARNGASKRFGHHTSIQILLAET